MSSKHIVTHLNRAVASLTLLFALSGATAAQQAEIRPQQNLAKWHISPANYSGITHIVDNVYAVVDDKSPQEGFYLFRIDINPRSGKVELVSSSELLHPDHPDRNSAYADCEGVAYVPQSNTLFITHEGSAAVKEYTLSGQLTGRRLAIPPTIERSRQANNGGFEALTYDSLSRHFWLINENTLKTDRHLADSLGRQSLRLTRFGQDLRSDAQWFYLTDRPLHSARVKYYTHGVPALAALPDGRLLVMERELSIPHSYIGGKCTVKIFLVDPEAGPTATSAPGLLPKKLVATFTTHLRIGRLNYANYEGMCLGPRLADGRLTLLLVNDSQAGAGNKFCTLKDYIKVIILPEKL